MMNVDIVKSRNFCVEKWIACEVLLLLTHFVSFTLCFVDCVRLVIEKLEAHVSERLNLVNRARRVNDFDFLNAFAFLLRGSCSTERALI